VLCLVLCRGPKKSSKVCAKWERCCRAARCGDDGHLALNKLGHQCRHAIELTLSPTIFDYNIAAIDETGFTEALTKCRGEMGARIGSALMEKPDHWPAAAAPSSVMNARLLLDHLVGTGRDDAMVPGPHHEEVARDGVAVSPPCRQIGGRPIEAAVS
jgi:hypothetical protein